MGLLEPITHKEEIERLLSNAKSRYEFAKSSLETQKEKTTKSLEKLGEVKIKAWAEDMDQYVNIFKSFKNIEVIQSNPDNALRFAGSNETPAELMLNIQQATMTAGEISRAGAAALGAGALVGIATYGGAMMFGHASTGTAIATLSGVAKSNATLAWFGGGAKAAGGLGIAGGKLVLAGIVVAPVLAVAATIVGAKAKEKLAEAQRIDNESKEASRKLDIITAGMSGIEHMSDNYINFITEFKKKFKPFIKELNKIKDKHGTDSTGKVDFDSLSVVEQKTLHLSWLMTQLYYHILSTKILTDQGELSPEANMILSSTKLEWKKIKKESFRQKGEDAFAADILWRTSALKVMFLNFGFVMLFIILGIVLLKGKVLGSIICFLGAFISFPIFFKFKNLPMSKLWMWRIVRLIGSIVFVLGFLIALSR